MKFGSLLSLIIVVSAGLIRLAQSAKILSVFPYPGPSQYIFGSALLKGLAKTGHEITSISTFPQKKPLKNFRDVAVMENANLFDTVISEIADDETASLFWINDFASTGKTSITNVFENLQVKALMQNEKFDLVIVEIGASEALLGLGEHFKAPVIAVSTFGTIGFLDYLVGNTSPLSYIPNMAVAYGNHMSLGQRLGNVVISAMESLSFSYFVLSHQEQLYKKYFPKATMTLDEARKNVSLVLINNHFTLNFPRPYVTNMIEVGGLHITEKPDPLPQDLQLLLDEASEGAIYFSMGSNLKSKDLPAEKLKIFLETFRELKVKVFWKFELDDLADKPDNVFIRKWYPQPSVLAHPNVKLFISHGGFLSTTETIFYGKPILGIPILADQFMNVKNAIKAGYAKSLQLGEITKETLKSSITELWTNPQYTEAVRHESMQFRDQPMTPLETAIYWVEYVIRHKGAVHMRNAGQDLNFWQYNNIDVYAILLGGFLVAVLGFYTAARFVQKLLFKKSKMSKKLN